MLRQAQKMEAVGQLTGGIAHDFNNLMTIVIGNLERLEEKFRDDPAVARSIKGAMAGAERGAALTQKLLAFGRRQPLAAQRIDANQLITNVADLMRRQRRLRHRGRVQPRSRYLADRSRRQLSSRMRCSISRSMR